MISELMDKMSNRIAYQGTCPNYVGLEYFDSDSPRLPDFPLLHVLNPWNITVEASRPTLTIDYYGIYSKPEKHITMYSPREASFLHELMHAAFDRNPDHGTGEEEVRWRRLQGHCSELHERDYS